MHFNYLITYPPPQAVDREFVFLYKERESALEEKSVAPASPFCLLSFVDLRSFPSFLSFLSFPSFLPSFLPSFFFLLQWLWELRGRSRDVRGGGFHYENDSFWLWELRGRSGDVRGGGFHYGNDTFWLWELRGVGSVDLKTVSRI